MKKTILSLLCVCIAATAQGNGPDSTDVFYKHLQLDELVVTGLAGDAKIKERPAPVSLVRPAELAARPVGPFCKPHRQLYLLRQKWRSHG